METNTTSPKKSNKAFLVILIVIAIALAAYFIYKSRQATVPETGNLTTEQVRDILNSLSQNEDNSQKLTPEQAQTVLKDLSAGSGTSASAPASQSPEDVKSILEGLQ